MRERRLFWSQVPGTTKYHTYFTLTRTTTTAVVENDARDIFLHIDLQNIYIYLGTALHVLVSTSISLRKRNKKKRPRTAEKNVQHTVPALGTISYTGIDQVRTYQRTGQARSEALATIAAMNAP